MKEILEHFNRMFENRTRLAIMSILVVNESVEFNAMKLMLNLTDGNLSTHMTALEKNRYVAVRKEFKGKKPLTTYVATAMGRRAFGEHLDALEQLIRNVHE